MIFGIFECISEVEQSLISERVTAVLQRAVSQGKKLGRPTKMNDRMKSAVKLLREKGMGIKKISKQLQIGVGAVYSVMNGCQIFLYHFILPLMIKLIPFIKVWTSKFLYKFQNFLLGFFY